MDRAPECPPRPDKNIMDNRNKNYMLKQASLMNSVPPLPSSASSSSMLTSTVRQCSLDPPAEFVNPQTLTNFQSNLLYESGQHNKSNQPLPGRPRELPIPALSSPNRSTLPQRPVTLLGGSGKPSLMPGSSLIDFDTRNGNNVSVSAEELENNQKVENIKKLINNTYTNVRTPDTPFVNGPIHPGSNLPKGIVSFIQNPLYSNVTPSTPTTPLSTMTGNIYPSTNLLSSGMLNANAYANILTQTYSNNSNVLNSPIHRQNESFDAFLYQQQKMHNELRNNEIMEKILNVAQEQQQIRFQQQQPNSHPPADQSNPFFPHTVDSAQSHRHLTPDILSPSIALSSPQFSPHLPHEILSLFDPLSQNDPSQYLRATHSPIPMSSPVPVYETNDSTTDNDHSPTDESSSELFNQIIVHSRDDMFSTELQEFVEHLRALYLSIKSKNSSITSLGLIWSPRIEIENVESGYVGSSDQYMISPGKKVRQGKDKDDETDFLLEVRYNTLIHCKLNGLPLPRPNGIDDFAEECNWYSIKIPATMQSVVETIVLFIIHNVGQESSNVNPDNFLIKVHGKNEYLIPKSDLFSYVYVQKCKRLNQDVVLEMIDITMPEFWRPFLEKEADTKILNDDLSVKQSLSYEDKIDFTSTNERKLNQKIEQLNTLVTQFLSITNIVNLIENEKKLLNGIISSIKSIQSELSGMVTSELLAACEDLDTFYNHHVVSPNDSNIEIDNDVLCDNFRLIFNNICDSIKNMIHLYSRTFPVDFGIPNADSKHNTLSKKTESIARNIQHLKLRVDSIFQMPPEFKSKYYFFVVRVSISYGFKILDYKLTLKQANNNLDWMVFNQELKFDSIVLSDLPREARINFELIGAPHSSANKNEFEVIATTFFYIFNQNRFLEHGHHLLTFKFAASATSFTANTEQIAMIKPKIADDNHVISLPVHPDSMMLIFSLPKTNLQYFFPEVDSLKLPSRSSTRRSTSSNHVSLNRVVPLPTKSSLSVPDSLYGFYGYSASNLNAQSRTKIIDIVQRNPLEALTMDECKLIWENRNQLSQIPGAILKILKAPSNFSSTNLRGIYSILEEYDLFNPSPLSLGSNRISTSPEDRERKLPFVSPIEALQLLGSDYPDQIIRRKAVWWLKTVSTDELCDYLPQLIQSLRYEPHLDCHLIWLLFECSLISARFCHFFYWMLKSNHNDPIFGARAKFYTKALLELCTGHCSQMTRQEQLCSDLAKISQEIKNASNSSRNKLLADLLLDVNVVLMKHPIGIPLSPSVQVDGLFIEKCSYFNSNSLPLKVVFSSAPPYNISDIESHENVMSRPNLIRALYKQKNLQSLSKTVIFKCGDDLRQDMLVMQIISIINRIWLRAGLDLRMVTFGVMNSHERTGMIEMVSQASTLREIQFEHGLAGNLKDYTIAAWLKRHNTNTYQYLMAVENFLHSCAGYVVITYLLGICDRHNDNIMITTSGHLFHIDFGKFLGDAQTISGIKRDRAPFVFTADMLYVINDGNKFSKNYQFFVELCCNCFSIVRQHGNFLLSLLSTMIPSGIFGLKTETIKFFHKALMPDLTDGHAKTQFNLLIEQSRDSFATQLNFLMHNIAQMRFLSPSSSSSNVDSNGNFCESTENSDDFSNQEPWKFSFSVKRATVQEDGKIIGIDVIGVKKTGKKNEKVYYNKVRVTREKNLVTHIYRSYKEFVELTEKLCETFKLAGLTKLPRSPILMRSNRFEVAKQRCQDVHHFIEILKRYSPEILHSDIVYTFFHQIHRDTDLLEAEPQHGHQHPVARKVKLTITYHQNERTLNVLVGHGRNFESAHDPTPSTYVKLYLRPDFNKSSKQKTRIISKNPNPVYMDTIVYQDIGLDELKSKALEVSVWANEMSGNRKIGSTYIYMRELNLAEETEKWYEITNSIL